MERQDSYLNLRMFGNRKQKHFVFSKMFLEVILFSVDGLIVEEKNVEQIAERLSVLVEDKGLCKNFEESARKKVEEKESK